jgi:hypothetical protein
MIVNTQEENLFERFHFLAFTRFAFLIGGRRKYPHP